MPKEGDIAIIPLWIVDKQVSVRFRWTGGRWANVEALSFPEGSITITIDGEKEIDGED